MYFISILSHTNLFKNNSIMKLNKESIIVLTILLVIIIYYLITQQGLISQFKALPSPLYGGDYYFQLGSITHIMEGGNPLKAPNILNSEPGYFILYSVLVAYFGLLFSLPPITAMFTFSYVLIVISLLLTYFLIYCVFKSHWIALLGSIIYIPVTKFPVLKYTQFTYALIVPLFFIAVYYFLEKRTLKSGVLLGITSGLMGLSHGSAFFVANFSLGILFLYLAFFQNFSIKDFSVKIKFNKVDVLKLFKLFLVIFLIGFSISLIYWYEPIFIHHGHTLNDMQNWAFIDLSKFNYQMEVLFSTLKRYFFNLGNIKAFFISIFSLFGIFLISKNLKDKKSKYILLLIIIAVVSSFHYFITEPILATHFSPQRMSHFIFPLATMLLFCFTIEKLISIEKIKKYSVPIILIILFSVLFAQHLGFQQHVENNKWIQTGKKPLSQDFLEMEKWVKDNTNVNDIFLSTNELSFALNALTGRKVMITRRSQNSPFIDIDQMEADAAVILYGKNSKKREELLKEYNTTYLYWSNYWIRSEYYSNEKGEITNWFDPILVKDIKNYKEYFESYNISYFSQNTWIDPAIKKEKIRKYNLLFVSPKNYRSFEKPWCEDLDNYLKEVWSYSYKDQTIARIYKVNYEK